MRYAIKPGFTAGRFTVPPSARPGNQEISNRKHSKKFSNNFPKAPKLTPDEFLELCESQKYSCAICGEGPGNLFIDHCHETGAIRGLLCGSCNSAIGLLGDSVEGVQAAVEYLSAASGCHIGVSDWPVERHDKQLHGRSDRLPCCLPGKRHVRQFIGCAFSGTGNTGWFLMVDSGKKEFSAVKIWFCPFCGQKVPEIET